MVLVAEGLVGKVQQDNWGMIMSGVIVPYLLEY